jgi:hypothetical protein
MLPALPVSTRRSRCLASSSSFCTKLLPTGSNAAQPRLSADHVESTAPRRPPLSHHSAAAHARQLRAAADHYVGPLSAPSPAPTWHRADPPPHPFPSPPGAPSAFKSRRLPTSLPFFSIFFSICSVRHCLLAPPPSLSAPSLVTSPPHHRETEPPPALTFRPLGEPGPPCIVACKWCAPHLLPFPPVLQDPATSTTRNQSTSTTLGHRRTASTTPPHVEPLLG